MNFDEIFRGFGYQQPSSTESKVARLEKELAEANRFKKAYVAALIDACNGDKILAKRLVGKYLSAA